MVWTNISDQNSGALQQLFKSNPEQVCKIFVYENHRIDNTNAYFKSKLVKPHISRWNEALSEKLGFTQKSWKKEKHCFLQDWWQSLSYQKSKKTSSAFISSSYTHNLNFLN